MSKSADAARERLLVATAVDRQVKNLIDYSNVPSSDAVRMGQIFGSYSTDAGATVNEHTAMRVSAVYAAVRLIAGTIATLPCTLYKRVDGGGRERVHDHPLWWLLNEQPTPRFSASAFWSHCLAQMLLRGDGLAYMVREGKYSPGIKAIIPLRRDNVTILRSGTDRLMYRITELLDDGKTSQYFTLDQDDVLHFPGDIFNGVSSLSVIGSAARQGIGIALRADEHAARTFGSGAHIQYAVTAPKAMTNAMQESFREAWVAKYSGQSGPSSTPLILTEGMNVAELSMTPADSQLLESRKFQINDIARAFGVPPHMIGDMEKSTSWGTGIEQMYIGFVRTALMPILARVDQELNRKLFPTRARYFFEHNIDALLEGDSKAQAEYFAKALGGPGAQGWMVVNEVRRMKNLPPIDGGDDIIKAGGTPPPVTPPDGAPPSVANPDDAPPDPAALPA